MFSKTKDELVKYRKLKYYRDIMKINIIFFLFFMLSDSMEIFSSDLRKPPVGHNDTAYGCYMDHGETEDEK